MEIVYKEKQRTKRSPQDVHTKEFQLLESTALTDREKFHDTEYFIGKLFFEILLYAHPAGSVWQPSTPSPSQFFQALQ